MTVADNIFVLDVKRTLYLMQLMHYHIEWFKSGLNGEHKLKTSLNNISNSHKRLLSEMSDLCSRKAWDLGQRELQEDYVKDLGLLLDELQDIADLTGIIEGVRKAKVEWKENAAYENV